MRIISTLVLTMVVYLAMSCSSDEQQVQEEINADGQQTSEEINNSDTEGNEGMVNQSEEINNVGDDEFADTGMNNELNLGNNNQMGAQQSLSNLAAPTENVPTEETPTNIAPPPVETAESTVPVDAAATLPATPTGNGVVKYVRSSTAVVDQPGGAAMGTLEQGDHPLVWDDGQYAKLPNGKMIPSSSLSEKGVGRPRSDNQWR